MKFIKENISISYDESHGSPKYLIRNLKDFGTVSFTYRQLKILQELIEKITHEQK